MARLPETPSQTAGPYVHIGLLPERAGLPPNGMGFGPLMRREGVRGEPVTLHGTIRDGMGAVVRDAIVECWQADAGGRFAGQDGADPAFGGFGRSAIDPDTGEWRFDTVRPGRVPWHDGRMQVPHATLFIIARGINLGLHTRLYFADGVEGDPLLSAIQPPERAQTMIARRDGDAWRLDIRLQGGPAGEAETVFLDV